ncbi:hypothetical protein MVEN_02388000 [Mycena venus]|uniref:Uncharacterized protein n=1 Tax=Mycena venus TaxID=2733690 RepID=A0A8H7CE99_9AGAR|nr:hypothetical protein MVEN_02388000 [Mycena venus]
MDTRTVCNYLSGWYTSMSVKKPVFRFHPPPLAHVATILRAWKYGDMYILWSRPFFALQALSGDEVLATSEVLRVTGVDTFPTTTSSPAANISSVSQPRSSADPWSLVSFPVQYYASKQVPTPSPSVYNELASSTSSPALNLPALIVGPVLAVVTLGVIIFISWTLCGCRRRPEIEKLAEP